MLENSLSLKEFDPEIWESVIKESTRQEDHIELLLLRIMHPKEF